MMKSSNSWIEQSVALPRRIRSDRTWRAWMIGWLGAASIGIGNAAIREATMRSLGDRRAHQTSTATLIVFLALYIRWLQRRRPLSSSQMAIQVGAAWALLTVAFEFAFGLGVSGDSLNELLDNYNIFEGRVWSLVPVWMFIGPYVASFYRPSWSH